MSYLCAKAGEGSMEKKREKSRTGERERTGSDSTKDHSTGIVKTLESVIKELILMWRVN